MGNMKGVFENNPFVTRSKPVCGAGSMILAMADTLNRLVYLSYRRMWISATDIDSGCRHNVISFHIGILGG